MAEFKGFDGGEMHAKMYMNINTRAVYYFKPAHIDNPDMVPYFGELPPIHPEIGLPIVPKEELGPQFAGTPSDEEIRPSIVEPVPDLTEKIEKEKEEKLERINTIASQIEYLKKFDFTSAGIPKVDALTRACDFTVTGTERDSAFALYLERKSIED